MTNTNIAGVILAGGKSSRMGGDKASLSFNNSTLLENNKQLLEDASITNIYISHPKIIPDIIPSLGPLSGIHSILKHIPKHHTHLVFLPIDMPALTISLIERLLTAPDNAPLVYFKSYKMPFRLSTDERWLELAEKILRKGKDVSLGSFQKTIPNHYKIEVSSDEQHCFENINTPEEWHRFNKGK